MADPRVVRLEAVRQDLDATAGVVRGETSELVQAQRLTAALTAIVNGDPDTAETQLTGLPDDVVERRRDAAETLLAITSILLAGHRR